MKKSDSYSLVFGALGMLIVILDGKTAIAGVQAGLGLCLQTLIPSLFPFFVLSPLITGSLMGRPLKCLRPVGRFCRMPEGTESLLAVGILGGYPLGAGMIGQEYRRGNLSKTEAQRLCIFCNNAGPSFLFGVLGSLFPSARWSWFLWITQISVSILVGFLLTGKCSQSKVPVPTTSFSLSDSMNRSIKNMAQVCGWVIMFRMILTYADSYLPAIPSPLLKTLLTGLLELSNGCLLLSAIENIQLRFLLAGILLSLGGVCVWMQTKSLFPELSLTGYIAGRLLHCSITIALSLLIFSYVSTGYRLVLFIVILSGLLLISAGIILHRSKKEVAFYNSMLYNSK